MSYAAIGKIIFETKGVSDYSGLLINDSTGNIVVPENGKAILGMGTYNE